MAQSLINNSQVIKRERFEDNVIQRSILFGLIRWDELVSTKHLGTEVHIFSNQCKKLFFNGKKLPIK